MMQGRFKTKGPKTVVGILSVVFCLGFAVGAGMFAPTAVPPEIKADTAPEEPARPAERTAPRSPYASIDHVRALIDIQATDDIARLRTAVIRSIWKRDQLPARVADEVVLDVDEPSVEGLASVAAVDTIPCW